ncbi:galactose-specific lectin nattectin-like [Synchiropus splendidus]|uniref:galactose-specific lectin nattectin-like n=1 Tax=Synchiropus splendidus TaxID=270530 RepID=UPI00237EE6E2|nr:galactose-specific lectin nattectin-like [Synchiropus splendidus]
MKLSLSVIVALCLASGLWIGAEALRGQEVCPPGWSQYGCKCFKFFGDNKDWADAEFFCVAQGGNLASIHSAAEHRFVKNLIKRATGRDLRTYVGGHDLYQEGRWSWSDGKRFVFPGGWHRGEPNNHGGREDCLELNFHGAGNDLPCHLRRPFVCTKPMI